MLRKGFAQNLHVISERRGRFVSRTFEMDLSMSTMQRYVCQEVLAFQTGTSFFLINWYVPLRRARGRVAKATDS